MVQLPNIYTFGQVKYDAEPLMKTYALIEQRRKANNEAFDKYLDAQAKTVNLDEVRQADREAFQGMFNDLRAAGIANKRLIATDPKAKMEYENKWRSLSNFAAQSKEEEKRKQPYLTKLASREGRDELNMERFKVALESHDQPLFVKDKSGAWVSNPDRQSLDFMKDYFKPKPVNEADLFRNWAANKERIEERGALVPNDPNTQVGRDRIKMEKIGQIVTKGYSPSSIKEIGVNAFENVRSNDAILNFYEWQYQNIKNTDELVQLDMTLKKYFPKETINSAPLLAKAKALKAAENATDVYTDEITDEEARLKRRKKETLETEARADRRKKIGGGGGGVTTINAFDAINTAYTGGTIVNGRVLDASGNRVNGTITLTRDQVPAEIVVPMTKGLGVRVGRTNTLEVKDGVIQSIQPAKGSKVSRAMILIGQQKFDAEPKGGGMKWGSSDDDNPLKIDLD